MTYFAIKALAQARKVSMYRVQQITGMDERTLRRLFQLDPTVDYDIDLKLQTLQAIANAIGVDVGLLISSTPPDLDDLAALVASQSD